MANKQLLHTFKHDAEIRSIAFSPDGKSIATAARDKLARLWNVAGGELLATFAQHEDWVCDVVFSPDGKYLVTSTVDGNTLLWDIATLSVITTLTHDIEVQIPCINYSSDGRYVAIGTMEALLLWDCEQKTTTRCSLPGYHINDICFSADSKYIAIATDKNIAMLLDLSGKVLATYAHHSKVSAVAFSPDGLQLATGSSDKSMRLWQCVYDSPHPSQAHDSVIEDMRFSPDGTQLVTSTSNMIISLWNTADGTEIDGLKISDDSSDIWATHAQVAFSPDGQKLATNLLGRVFVWSIASAKAIDAFALDMSVGVGVLPYGGGLCFSPDGMTIAVATEYKVAWIWDFQRRQLVARLAERQEYILCMAYTPNGASLITGLNEGTVRIWDTHDYAQRFVLKGHGGGVSALCVSPDSNWVATGDLNGSVRLWALRDGRLLKELHWHRDEITVMGFSPDSTLLLTVDRYGQAVVWRIGNDEQETHVTRPVALYRTAHTARALHWVDTRHVLLAGADARGGRPHFYRLALEGAWE